MAVLTIFNHGTGFGRAKGVQRDELVAWMHENITGSEVRVVNDRVVGQDFIVNDGPGSGTNRAGVHNPFTGVGKSHEGFKYGKGRDRRSSFANSFAGQTATPSNMSGNISGAGWDDVVARSVFLATSLIEGGRDIQTVNLCGWSRGAVVCIRIANKFYELFGDRIRINIFGVDPVAGMKNGVNMVDTRILPPNIDYACFVLSMHERRKTFKPQDLSRITVTDSTITRLTYLPMPGVHGHQVMAAQGLEDPAYATRSLCLGFLRHFGSRFTGAPAPFYNTPRAMTLAYARMKTNIGVYKAHQTGGFKNRLIGGGLSRRSFATSAHMSDYVRGGKKGYWVNEHHRACFKAACPRLYQTIFHQGMGQLRNANTFASMQGNMGPGSPFANSLLGFGFATEMSGSLQIIEGAGRYTDQGSVIGYTRHWPSGLPLNG